VREAIERDKTIGLDMYLYRKTADEKVGQWRKANAIHKWFVENVQSGDDNCAYYYVDQSQLKNLLDLVEMVLADHSKAEDLLPTAIGFFFGDTGYDESYFENLEETRQILNAALRDDTAEYQYHSSW
jgi:hypothetical protein